MNVITHSGGNEFRGQVFSFFTDQALHSSPKLGTNDTKLDKSSQYDVGFSIGGPLMRDQLWFFAAYNPTFDNRVSSFPGSGPLEDKTTQHLFASKLTWQPASSSTVVLTLIGDPSQRNSVGPGGFFAFPGAVANTDPVLGKTTQGGTAVSLRSQHLIGSDVLLSFFISRLDRKDDSEPLNMRGSNSVPARLDDYVTGVASGGYGALTKRTSARTALQASATFVSTSHTLKVGAEYEDIYLDAKDEISLVLHYVDTSYSWFRYSGGGIGLPVLYVQDSWLLFDRFHVNIGLRWDGQYLVNAHGLVAQSISNEFQPRIGFVYQPGEAGSQKLFGSVGRFYEQVPVYPPSMWYGAWSQTIVDYRHNPLIDPRGADTASAVASSAVPTVPGLHGEYFDEISLGYERLFMNEFKMGIRGVYRTLRSAIEDGFGPDGVYRMGNPGEGRLSYLPRATREYMALEITLERFSDVGLSFQASYVLSRNYGNYTGLAATDFVSFGSNNGPQFDLVEQTVNSTGLLPNDKTNVFKFFGTYRFDFGLTAGAGFLLQSGMPLSEYGTPLPGMAPYWSFVLPRGTAGRAPSN